MSVIASRCKTVKTTIIAVLCTITLIVYYRNSLKLVLTDHANEHVACQYPVLDPFDKSILKFVSHPRKFNCKNIQPSLSMINNAGCLWLNETEVRSLNTSGNLACYWRTIDRALGTDDDGIEYGLSRSIISNTCQAFPSHDTIEVVCKMDGKGVYYNLHNHPRSVPRKILNSSESHLSVLMFILDSTSLNAVRRHLPRTYNFLTKVMGVRIFEGYTKVADNTHPNVVPMLLGRRIYDQQSDMLSEAPTTPGKQYDTWDLIWKRYALLGYVTAFIEDLPKWGTFNNIYNGNGFATKPSDHYFRPFFLAQTNSKLKNQSSQHCFGNIPSLTSQVDISLRLLRKYKYRRYFLFAFHVELTHQFTNDIERADSLLESFFKIVFKEQLLNHTMMMFLSDHGRRFGAIRDTVIGGLEERMPVFGLFFPKWFYQMHRNIDKAISINRHRLSSPFDIHQTLIDVLYGNYSTSQLSHSTRGLSQLYVLPALRKCAQAGIPYHYCVCGKSKPMLVNDSFVREMAEFAIAHVNKLLTKVADKCARLTLRRVMHAEAYEVNQLVSHNIYATSEAANLNRALEPRGDVRIYRILVEVMPSGAHLEASAHYNMDARTMTLPNYVSRTNKYGAQSKCISDENLRKYCYCKDLEKSTIRDNST